MKKLVAFVAMSIIFFGITVSSVSAEKYEVEKGDNLWNLAKEYDTTVKHLMEINHLSTTVIHPNQEIIINETYIVERGDTLIGIGKQYDVSVDEIIEWNDLKTSLLLIGQELELHGVNVEQKDSGTDNDKKNATSEKASKKASTKSKSTKQAAKQEKKPEGKTLSVTATAYTAGCDGCTGVTYTGVDLNSNPNAKVIAVDPKVIPLGTEVYVEGYGYATAADIGGAIKGNKIDLHVPTKKEAFSWGVRTVNVTIMD